MKRSPMSRGTKPLRAKKWGVSSKPRKPIAKRGRQKAKREKAYHAHLSSKYWLTLRWLCFQRDNGRCRKCGQAVESLRSMHLAHVTYARFGHERMDDVQCWCAPCNIAERAGRAWYAGRIA